MTKKLAQIIMTVVSLNLKIHGDPVSKARPRFGKGRVHSDPKQKQFENNVRQIAWVEMQKRQLRPSTFRTSIKMTSFFAIPKSFSKKRILEAQAGIIIPPRHDVDNLIKPILDAIQGPHGPVLFNDSQVWHITACKRYVDVDMVPQTKVVIQWDDGGYNCSPSRTSSSTFAVHDEQQL